MLATRATSTILKNLMSCLLMVYVKYVCVYCVSYKGKMYSLSSLDRQKTMEYGVADSMKEEHNLSTVESLDNLARKVKKVPSTPSREW